jgi:hypothetical protein
MCLSLLSLVGRNRNVLHAQAGDEIVMMSIEAGAYYGLDKVGRRIWEMLEEPINVSDLCAHLTAEYDVAEEICHADVLTFLAELAEHGIIDINVQQTETSLPNVRP